MTEFLLRKDRLLSELSVKEVFNRKGAALDEISSQRFGNTGLAVKTLMFIRIDGDTISSVKVQSKRPCIGPELDAYPYIPAAAIRVALASLGY